MNHSIKFLDRDNKTKLVPASFSYISELVIVINNLFNLSIIKKLIKPYYLHCSCKNIVEKSNKDNLKVVKNTLPNKSGNPESLKK